MGYIVTPTNGNLIENEVILMSWGHNHKIGFILNYDERKEKWKAEFEISNRYTEVKYFNSCKAAQEYYEKHYEGKRVG